MTEQSKWYESTFGQGIGYGVLAMGIGIAILTGFKGCKHEKIEIYKADKQVEVQRLQTIEEVTRQCGGRMEPNDLIKFLKETNLDK